ncbi:hypothetical protein BpHYR1_015477 [Brachionus plicatilis]|uniref:Uncharacterized protein n=1 Tax=Brachionus plicatilis TaxID=10195 RepID=A0A3M7PL01_BRAPC|nr:hypothetical protein BpHYR1_015477 [Brachionus plicatilis]
MDLETFKKRGWAIYSRLVDAYIDKLHKRFQADPTQSIDFLRNSVMVDLMIQILRSSNRETIQNLWEDPRIQQYFQYEVEDITKLAIDTISGEFQQTSDRANRMIAGLVPHDQLQEYDLTHGSRLTDVNAGRYEEFRKEKAQLEADFALYEQYVKDLNVKYKIQDTERKKPAEHVLPIDNKENLPIKESADNNNDRQILKPNKKQKLTEKEKPEQQLIQDEEEPEQIEADEQDQSSEEPPGMQVDIESTAKSGASSGAQGHHGSFIGTTTRHIPFEKTRYEREVIKCHQRRDEIHYFGMSNFISDFNYDPPNVQAVTIGTGSQANKTGLIWTTGGVTSIIAPFGTQNNNSISPLVKAQFVNFRVKDFIDHKILTGTGGKLRSFKKITLAEIHVEVEIHTNKGSFFDNEVFLNRWSDLTTPKLDQTELREQNRDLTWSPKYFVHRDVYGEYSTSAGLIPEDKEYGTGITIESTPSRKLQSIRQRDHCSDIVSNGWSFTRKIQSGGPYYLTPAKIWDLRNNSISNLINEIEGQSADSSGNLNKWPEYFNFLFVPLNAHLAHGKVDLGSADTRGVALTPNFHCELHIKTTATWLCMDRTSESATIGLKVKSDPYYEINNKLRQEEIQYLNTH